MLCSSAVVWLLGSEHFSWIIAVICAGDSYQVFSYGSCKEYESSPVWGQICGFCLVHFWVPSSQDRQISRCCPKLLGHGKPAPLHCSCRSLGCGRWWSVAVAPSEGWSLGLFWAAGLSTRENKQLLLIFIIIIYMWPAYVWSCLSMGLGDNWTKKGERSQSLGHSDHFCHSNHLNPLHLSPWFSEIILIPGNHQILHWTSRLWPMCLSC